MDTNDFLAALAPALTDADARARFMAEPRGALAAAGLILPDWIAVTAREGDAPELAVTLPPLLDADAELNEEQLAAVSGGCNQQPSNPQPPFQCGTGCQS